MNKKGLVRSTRVAVFRVSFRRLAVEGAGVGVGAGSKSGASVAYHPAIAFVLATGRGTRWRRQGQRRTYALGAVGPGAEDGRGGVDHVEDGAGRRAFAPAVAGRLAVARGVKPDAEREKKAAKVP